MNGFVLDASVALKWVLQGKQETLVQEAANVLSQYVQGRLQFAVPDLFWCEAGNTLWKAVRSNRLSRRSAEEALRLLLDRNFPTFPSHDLLQDAFAIAAAVERTVYDSVYLALATVTGRPLLTADERLANALASRFPIRWLGALY